MLVLAGSCHDFPAALAIDHTQACSVVSTRFVVAHNLPCICMGSPVRVETSSVVRVPSPSGWFSSSFQVAVEYVAEYDVILGGDWCSAVGYCGGQVVPDPSGPLTGSVAWTRSPQTGEYLSPCSPW